MNRFRPTRFRPNLIAWLPLAVLATAFLISCNTAGAQELLPIPEPETIELSADESAEFDYSPAEQRVIEQREVTGELDSDPIPQLGQELVEEEHRGSLDSRMMQAVLGTDPVVHATSLMQQVESVSRGGDWPTSTATIGKLPPIDDLVFGPESYQRQGACGIEKRKIVSKTNKMPWQWTCKLVITMPNNQQYVATGWLVGPRTVITSGHAVHSGGTGGTWAKSIEVIPGMRGSSRPFGTFRSSRFVSVKGWTRSKNMHYDYAAIILNTDLGKRLGYFGYASYSSKTLRGMKINTAGYPADLSRGKYMYRTYDPIQSVSSSMIYYNFVTAGGQSGSAVWRLNNKKRYAVGIHGYGCPNSAVRINSTVFKSIRKWKYRR